MFQKKDSRTRILFCQITIMPKMVSTGDSKDVSKGNGHHTSQIFHCLTTLVCFMLSASSVAVCLFMNVKTSHLERKVELLEMERLSVIQPVHATLDAHATLWDAIEKLVQEVSEKKKFLPTFMNIE